jgi:putative endonuclease
MIKGGYVYIITNKHNTALYVGVTSGLVKRMWEHRSRLHAANLTARHNLNKLVYFESFESMDEAIAEQTRIVEQVRKDQVQLIEAANPNWNDLMDVVREEKLLRQLSLF